MCKVTVFMAVYNGEKYIREAIDSVLCQTFGDFELLIVDDGSTDNSLLIIQEYNDKRIRVVQNHINQGLFFTRNRGIEEARGSYFATLDCDDIALKARLQTQVNFLEKNRNIAMCGGRIRFIDSDSKFISKLSPLKGESEFLKALMLFSNIFSNSATMIRMDILKQLMFRKGYEPAEDFDLFERISSNSKVGFINEFLSCYRVHSNNISTLKSQIRKAAERSIIERQLKRYGFNYTERELEIHLRFTTAEFDFGNYPIQEYANWFTRLIEQNNELKNFEKEVFGLVLARQWLRMSLQMLKTEKKILPFFKKGKLTYSQLFKAFLKSLY